MSPSSWQYVSLICFLLAVGSLGGAAYDWGACVWNTGAAMAAPAKLDPIGDAERIERVDSILGQDEPPASSVDRMKLAHPVCIEEYSAADNVAFYATFLVFLLGGFFARNQAKIASEPVERVPDRPIRPTPAHEPKRSANEPVQAIDIGEDADLGLGDERSEEMELEAERYENEDEKSLMTYVEQQVQDQEEAVLDERESTATVDGFYCPPGYEDRPIVYVDPDHEDATDEPSDEAVDNPDLPFVSLEAALAFAGRRVVTDAAGIQVRVMPGVYQEAIDVPDRVVVVNHRLPAEGTGRQRLTWLMEQDIDHPDCVTLHPPGDDEHAVRFGRGKQQGIFGCHIIGRDDATQTGLVSEGSIALAVLHCNVEGFRHSALRLEDSGTELPGQQVIVSGCRVAGNQAPRGGAIHAERTALLVEGSLVEFNRARTGGAIWATDMKGPLTIKTTRVAKNRAQLKKNPEVRPRMVGLSKWQKTDGLGGGVWLRNSKLRIAGSEFVENGASVGGGAIALLGCRGVVQPGDDEEVRFARNKARVGGAMIVIGWNAAQCTLKCTETRFEENVAAMSGGGLSTIGLAKAQCIGSTFRKNRADGDDAIGGAVSCHNGGEFIALDTELFENRAGASGGAIAALNAGVRLGDGTSIRKNAARKEGGGLWVMTEPSELIESMVSNSNFKLPFAVQIKEARISDNACSGKGGGIRGGNNSSQSTLPIDFEVHRTTRVSLNRSKSGNTGADVWVTWAGKMRADDASDLEELLLK